MKEKRGSAHFEMITSFIFFIGFIFFLFLMIKPYEETTISNILVQGVYDSLYENTKTNYTKIFFKSDSSISECFYIDFEEEKFKYPLEKSIVKGATNLNEVDSTTSNGGRLDLNKRETYYYATFSPGLDEESVTCTEMADSLEIGSILEKEIISLKKLEQIETEYGINYENLKTKLKVPKIYDFSIISPKIDVYMEKEVPDSVEVIAKDYIIEVLDENKGEIKISRITIKTW